MERCRTLSDYMKFVNKVRSHQNTLGIEAAEQIAEELEESTDNLRPIIDTAERFAPEYDIDSILGELNPNKI